MKPEQTLTDRELERTKQEINHGIDLELDDDFLAAISQRIVFNVVSEIVSEHGLSVGAFWREVRKRTDDAISC